MLLFLVRDVVRTAHVLAAGVWVGGSIVYLVVITPALRLEGVPRAVGAKIAALFRSLVNVAIGVLLVTGVFLVADRLAVEASVLGYWVVLGLKVAVSLAMFGLAFFQAQEARRPAPRRSPFYRRAPRLILTLGVVAFVLGTTLTLLFEAGPAAGH